MTDQKHNGWTNYATWRIHLELFDGVEYDQPMEPNTLKDMAEEIVTEECIGGKCPDPNHLAVSYAMAFMNDVNWFEIAQHVNEKD
tara:strand:- start:3852 stop:4106 length:255 start_codon:yes stop_codon:yes gene_type:complete